LKTTVRGSETSAPTADLPCIPYRVSFWSLLCQALDAVADRIVVVRRERRGVGLTRAIGGDATGTRSDSQDDKAFDTHTLDLHLRRVIELCFGRSLSVSVMTKR
jgi:hypothetical protein